MRGNLNVYARVAASVLLAAAVGVCGISTSSAQNTRTANVTPGSVPAAPAVKKQQSAPKQTTKQPKLNATTKKYPYYVDFRARTAASYGHAFVWYGRVDRREVEIAGLHPASESIIPYMIGHVIPVPSETGASYGDLDDQYLTANYKIFLSEDEAQRTFGYIKHLQKTQVLWHAALYNCVSFIRDIAIFVGLKVPSTPLLKPEEWVNELLVLNGKSPKIAVQNHRY